MASAISYELFTAKRGAANGIASLDTNTKVPVGQLPAGDANGVASLDAGSKIPVAQLPDVAIDSYKGVFADEAALVAAYATAAISDYAYVTATTSYWYWNAALGTPAWVNQQITETAYNALTVAQRAGVPYIVIS
ncbi:MAG: hypothetical protein AB9836_09690 [Aminipila sp.]